MPSATELYGGNWLKATDLSPVGKRRIAVINDTTSEIIGQDRKQMLALTLASQKGAPWPRRLLLNKGNMLQLVVAYGDEYLDWIGRPVEIWSENVLFQGRMVPGIKVLPAQRSQAMPQPAVTPPVPLRSSVQDTMPAHADPDPDPGPGPDYSARDLDDEIPF